MIETKVVMPKYKVGEVVCDSCKKKIEGKNGVTGVLSDLIWFCLDCLKNDAGLMQGVKFDLKAAPKGSKYLGEVYWTRYPGRLGCLKHRPLAGEGVPTYLYMANGLAVCAVCLCQDYPKAYAELVERVQVEKGIA